MATTIEGTLDTAVELPPVPVRRFTLEEFHRLGEIGIIGDDERVELLEGWIVPMMTRRPEHDYAITLLDDALRPFLTPQYYLRMQMAISLKGSLPEPDCAIVHGPREPYRNRYPESGDVVWIAEVSDSTLRKDRGIKARIYAGAGIAVYWIVNLPERQLEVLTSPAGDSTNARYAQATVFRAGDRIPLVLGGKTVGEIAAADLLP